MVPEAQAHFYVQYSYITMLHLYIYSQYRLLLFPHVQYVLLVVKAPDLVVGSQHHSITFVGFKVEIL